MIKKKKRFYGMFALFAIATSLVLPIGGEIAEELTSDISSIIYENSEDSPLSSGGGYYSSSSRSSKTTGSRQALTPSVAALHAGVTTWAEAFPDAKLRTFVAQHTCGLGASYDDATNSEDTLSSANITAISTATNLIVSSKSIVNLAGIEHFSALLNLNCSYNAIPELDVSTNTALTTLICSVNQLTELDVSTNTSLTSLQCYSNKLTELDVSTNTALTSLQCQSNQLTELDVSTNTALTSLLCNSNLLTELNVSTNTALTTLECESNQLTELELSTNNVLEYLKCKSNQITSLDVSGKTYLKSLSCFANQLTELDVSGSTALTSLQCYMNQLTELDVSTNTALKALECNGNQLTELDVSTNTALTSLQCYMNQLTELDLSTNTALTLLRCYGNQLTELDVSTNTSLTTLACYGNQLTELDVSTNTALTSLQCQSNQLTELDVSTNTALTSLYCQKNKIVSLNLNGLTKLSTLDCSNNNIVALDVSTCIKLYTFNCYSNELISLTLGTHPELNLLYCYANKISSLDISLCPNITQLDFSFNRVTSFQYNSASETKIRIFNYHFNEGLEVDLSNFTTSFSSLGFNNSLSGYSGGVINFIISGTASPTDTGALYLYNTGYASFAQDSRTGWITNGTSLFEARGYRLNPLTNEIYGGSMVTHRHEGVVNPSGIYVPNASTTDIDDNGILTIKSSNFNVFSGRGRILGPTYSQSTVSIENNIAKIDGNFLIEKFGDPANGVYDYVSLGGEEHFNNSGPVYVDMYTLEIIIPKYTLTYDITDELGTSTECGTVTGASSGDQIEEDTAVELTATPEDGYSFVGWYDANDNLLSRNPVNSFNMTEDKYFEAHFKETTSNEYQLNYSVQDGGSLVDYSHREGTYNKDEVVTLEVDEATEDDLFIGWYEGDNLLSRSKEYVFTLEKDTTLIAKFKGKAEAPAQDLTLDYHVELMDRTQNVGGSITGTPAGTYETDDPISLTAVPDEGYSFVGWYDTTSDALLSRNPARSFVMETNVNLAAVFKPVTEGTEEFTFQYEQPIYGTITGSRIGTYDDGDSISVTASPKPGYRFSGWFDSYNRLITWDENYSFNITKDTFIRARFVSSTYDCKLTYEAIGPGSISGNIQGYYGNSSSITLTASADSKSKFIGWYIDDILVSRSGQYAFAIKENTHVVARFKANPAVGESDYTLDYSVAHQDGTAGKGGSISGTIEGTYDQGTSISLTASANPTFKFVGWYDGDKLLSRRLNYIFNINANTNLVAMFKDDVQEPDKDYLFNYSSAGNGEVSSSLPEGTYNEDTEITVEAVAETDYAFVGWYENDKLVSRDAEYTFEIDHDTNLVAQFKKITAGVKDYTLDYYSETPAHGSVGGTQEGTYDEGTEINIVATPADGYKFVGWYDMNDNLISREADYIFDISENTKLKAVFKEIVTDPIVDYDLDFMITGNGSTTGTRAGTYNANTLISIVAVPDEDHIFEGFYIGGNLVEGNDTYAFSLKANTIIEIRFKADSGIQQYRYQYIIEGNGAVTSSKTSGGLFDANTAISLNATPNTGNSFVGYYDENNKLLSDVAGYVHTLKKDIRITVRFKVKTNDVDEWKLRYTIEGDGSVTGDYEGLYDDGTSISLEAIPNTGSKVVGFYNALTNRLIEFTDLYEFDIEEDTYLLIVFKSDDAPILDYEYQYTIVGSGSVTGTREGLYNANTLISVNVTPEDGHKLAAIYDSNYMPLSWDAPYEFNLKENTHLIILFKEIPADEGSDYRLTYEVEHQNGDANVGGSILGDKQSLYDEGTSINLFAQPDAGYVFAAWYDEDYKVVSWDDNYIFDIESDTHLIAMFKDVPTTFDYQYTFGSGANGIVTSSHIESRYDEGTSINLVATPESKYGVEGWYLNDMLILDSEGQFNMEITISEDSYVEARFRRVAYDVDVTVEGNGTVTGDGGYDELVEVTLVATPEADSIFVGWYENDIEVEDETTYVISSISRDYDLVAKFRKNKYLVDVTVTEGGSVSGNAGLHVEGSDVSVIATPDEGYEFVGWYSMSGTILSDELTYLIEDIQADHELWAIFRVKVDPVEYEVSVIVEAGEGVVTGEGNYVAGQNVILEAIPELGYQFDGYYDSDDQLIPSNGNILVIYNLQEDTEIKAIFSLIPVAPAEYEVILDTDGNGSVTGQGIYVEGDDVTIEATADANWEFYAWVDENDIEVSYEAIYTIEDIDSEVKLTAVFNQIAFDVNVLISGNGSVTGSGTYLAGENVSLIATPDINNEFVGWYDMEGNFLSEEKTYNKNDIDADLKIQAIFKAKGYTGTYEVEVSVDGEGSVTGAGTYNEGELVILIATPDAGQEFIGWEIDGIIVETDYYYIIDSIDSDYRLIAIFDEDVTPGNMYEVTTIAEGNGSVTGSGTYKEGLDVILVATPDAGHELVGWYIGDTLVGEDSYYILTNLSKNEEVRAVFKEIVPDGSYEVRATIDGSGSVSGTGIYEAGSLVILVATADADNKFIGWYVEGTFVSGDYFLVLENLDQNHYYEARFEAGVTPPTNPHEVTTSIINGLGLIEGAGIYEHDTKVLIIATPNEGYKIKGFYIDGILVGTESYYIIDPLLEDVQVDVYFELIVAPVGYEVTTEADGNGSIVGGGTYNEGQNVVITATPDEGSRFIGFVDANGDSIVSDGATLIIYNIHEDIFVKAVFEVIPAPVTYDVDVTVTEGGSVTGEGTYSALVDVTLLATPEVGYQFDGWYDLSDDLISEDKTYVITNISADYDLVAKFSEIPVIPTYEVSITKDGEGSVTGAGTYNEGQNVILEATPDAGYRFAGYYDSEGILIPSTNGVLVIMNIDADHEIEVIFEIIPPVTEYEVIVHIGQGGNVTGAGTYGIGEDATLEVIIEAGYEFVGWYDMDGGFLSNELSYEILDIQANHELQAIVKEIVVLDTYDVSIVKAGDGSVTGSGTYNEGEDVTLVAEAALGYEFVGWYENDTLVSEDKTYVITNIDDDYNLTAMFQEIHVADQYELAYGVEGHGNITGFAEGSYDEGTLIVISAVATEGYRFKGWYDTDGNLISEDVLYYFEIEENTELVAVFEEIPHVTITHDVVIDTVGGGSATGSGTYTDGTTITIKATPIEGHEFLGWYDSEGNLVSGEMQFDITVDEDLDLTAKFSLEPVPGGDGDQPNYTWVIVFTAVLAALLGTFGIVLGVMLTKRSREEEEEANSQE